MKCSEVELSSESTLQLSIGERLARNLLFRVFKEIQHGQLTLSENGRIVGCFGSSKESEEQPQLQAEINIVEPGAYKKIVFQGDVGAGEAFTDGLWTSPDVTAVIRFFAMNMNVLDNIQQKFSWISWPVQKLSFVLRANSKRNARKNISAHYDLGNELYTRFLDSKMQYSSAVYPGLESSLEEAQDYKLQKLCESLALKPTDHLLEIGTGWGGLAIYAAKNYGCKVTTTTISQEQFEYAKARASEEGVADQIEFLMEDYRDLSGTYDKLVSVEMIEAVGERYMEVFFRQCNALLKPGGKLVLQAITIADQRLKSYNNHVDFIQTYIFPGGYLPSLNLISNMFCRKTGMVIRDVEDIGQHYARTLADWRHRFNSRFGELKSFGYNDRFSRLWNYYLSYCEGGFVERRISAVQLLAEKDRY